MTTLDTGTEDLRAEIDGGVAVIPGACAREWSARL
jgi:hypothetical protein